MDEIISIRGLELNHVSKRGPGSLASQTNTAFITPVNELLHISLGLLEICYQFFRVITQHMDI